MLKAIVIPIFAIAVLTACSTTVGLANPASVFCEEQGGVSLRKTYMDGNEYAICRLKNGTEVEEWDYFRENHLEKELKQHPEK